ncbi:hypothetical protein [Roseococcus sp. YIM B11640]|uniref:hypothetical protein n=1 Tax=Roseococcus sp. YIM B11640 TaxID=3133973 RepID=UPI003C799E50
MNKERKWIVLGEDGRHVTIGRNSDPTVEEIEIASKALRDTGMGGWLAIQEGSYFSAHQVPHIFIVRELSPTAIPSDIAIQQFEKARQIAVNFGAPQP